MMKVKKTGSERQSKAAQILSSSVTLGVRAVKQKKVHMKVNLLWASLSYFVFLNIMYSIELQLTFPVSPQFCDVRKEK